MKLSDGMPHIEDATRILRLDHFAGYVSVLPWFNTNVLHKLYINIFKRDAAYDERYSARAITCADVIHSPSVKRIISNVFVLENDIQDELRNLFIGKQEDHLLLGQFMQAYASDCREHFLGPKYVESFQIEANFILNPNSEASRISQHIIRRLNQSKSFDQKKKSVGYYLDILEKQGAPAKYGELIKFLKGIQEFKKEDTELPESLKTLRDAERVKGDSISIKIPAYVREKILKEIAPEQTKRNVVSLTSFHIGEGKDTLRLKEMIEGILSRQSKPYVLTEDPVSADYLFRWQSDEMWFCRQGQESIPVATISSRDANEFGLIADYIAHIANWEQVRRRGSSPQASGDVSMEIFDLTQDGREHRIEHSGTYEFDYTADSNNSYRKGIILQVTNHGKEPVNCSVLYLSNRFEIKSDVLDEQMIRLEPGQVVRGMNGSPLMLDLEPYVEYMNTPYCESYFKLLVSKAPFIPEYFRLAPLPVPSTVMLKYQQHKEQKQQEEQDEPLQRTSQRNPPPRMSKKQAKKKK